MPKRQFFEELKRRNIYRVAITYAMVAWLLIQIASILLPTFEAPPWIMKVWTLVLIIGFPIALLLAWAYEYTPEKPSNIEENPKNYETNVTKKNWSGNIIIGILSVLIVVQFVYNRFSRPTEEAVIDHEKSIAVLPLINLNSDNENLAYFSDGVTQEIIDELAKVRSFSLTAFTTSLLYKNNSKPYDVIGKELNTNYLVTGTSRIYHQNSIDSVVLSMELIDVKTKKRIWNGRYNEQLQDAPRIQLAIAKQIASSLSVNLSPQEAKSLTEVNTTSGDAFQLFLKARNEMAGMQIGGFDHAEKYLLEAVKLDPNYSQAYTLLAWNYVLQGWSWYWRGDIPIEDARKRALDNINQALQIEPNSSDVHLVRANFGHTFQANLKKAIDDVETALAINSWPEVPTNYCICSAVTTYVLAGNLKRAKELAKIAVKIDPGNVFLFHDQGIIYMQEGKMVEAQAMFRKALDFMDIPIFNFLVGWSLYHNGQYKESIPYFENFKMDDYHDVGVNLAYLSNAYFKMGDIEKSNQFKLKLEDTAQSDNNPLFMAKALVSSVQGSRESTISYLQKAYEIKEPMMTYLISLDPLFKPLHNHQTYKRIWDQILNGKKEPVTDPSF